MEAIGEEDVTDDPFGDDPFFGTDSKSSRFGDPSEYGISLITHPMNFTPAQMAKQGGMVCKLCIWYKIFVVPLLKAASQVLLYYGIFCLLQVTNIRVATAFFQSMFVIFALSFVPASFVVFLIGECQIKSFYFYCDFEKYKK